MVSAETPSVLSRKAAKGTKEQEARAMSVAKAMRQSLAKLGKELFEMPLSVIGAVTEDCEGAALPEIVGETALLCLLEGDKGRVGAAVIDADIVGGLIQQQTMGQVNPAKGDTRKMTQTDAAMCAPLLDRLFARVVPMLEVEAERAVVGGYTFGARFENARALGMALDMAEYFVIRLTLDLAGGARQGEMSLILPKVPAAGEQGHDNLDQNDASPFSVPQMSDVVMGVPTELNMVLCKLSFELSQVKELTVGGTIRLPQDTFPETEIFTGAGKVLGTGILGQVNGIRALRLKRLPVHASQPRRRESDLSELDLPEITALPEPKLDTKIGLTKTDTDQRVIDSGEGLPALKDEVDVSVKDTEDVDLPDDQKTSAKKHTLQNTELPELEDFPDLAELTQVG